MAGTVGMAEVEDFEAFVALRDVLAVVLVFVAVLGIVYVDFVVELLEVQRKLVAERRLEV